MPSNKAPSRSGGRPSQGRPNGARPANGSSVRRPTDSTTIKRGNAAPPPPTANNTVTIIVVGLILLAVAIFVSVLVIGGTSSSSTAALPTVVVSNTPGTASAGDIPVAADPTAQIQTFTSQGQDHIGTAGETGPQLMGHPYNSDPPTSGAHLPAPSPWGIFNQPLQNELQIHNLEHGGIMIQYDCPQGCSAAINALAPYALKYPPSSFTGVILAPRPNLPNGSRIALTAWTHLLLLKTLDQTKIQQFVAAYIGKGPEQDPSFRP